MLPEPIFRHIQISGKNEENARKCQLLTEIRTNHTAWGIQSLLSGCKVPWFLWWIPFEKRPLKQGRSEVIRIPDLVNSELSSLFFKCSIYLSELI